MSIQVLFLDPYYVAVNKPPGLLVHRSRLAQEAKEFLLQSVRNQLNQRVYPIHRLDRKTSGVVLFGLTSEAANKGHHALKEEQAVKEYLALVRGFTPADGVIDKPLTNERGIEQACLTHYTTLERFETPIETERHATSRYTLVRVTPETGRMHQIRKHFNHLRHPVIGDRPHGCNKQNKLFKVKFNMTNMLLHAARLEFTHPFTGQVVVIEAPLFEEFNRMLTLFRRYSTACIADPGARL